MRVTALIVGISGAVAGLFGALLLLNFGYLQAAYGHEGASSLAIRGLVILLMSGVGFVGAMFAVAKPRLAAALLLISVTGGVIGQYLFYAVPALLLLIAAIFAFFGRQKPAKVAL